ncbi:hypothetical protein AC579_6054 [Pseudocercospora musae]|uniref:tRNA wybutosine-synthesizing protein 3 n=1 Tax=Pseudocercospora musae TaxID=113226 RepID=A0A139HUH9_9PEZI|nr:hypothetical protein AC579_6054 [Pseudocercospora musae]
MSGFQERKAKILEDLARPDEQYDDLSPKGSVDTQIRDLVDSINQRDGYVTTSSCAGRIAVFLEGAPKSGQSEVQESADVISASTQGKGGGRWLFVSHDPLDMSALAQADALASLLGLPHEVSVSCPGTEERPRFVHLKFEPMILHVLTSSLQNAQHCHTAAMSAGFRESGISTVTGPNPTPMVAIRTQGLALETIIAYQDTDGTIRPMVSDQYLRTLLELANSRFRTNAQRTKRFQHAFLGHETNGDHKHKADWEPADVRRDRKRAEGLKKRAEMGTLKLDMPTKGTDGTFEHDDFDVGRFADEL